MSVTRLGRARLATAVIPAAAGLMLASAGLALPAAQAAVAPHAAGLHVTGRVNLTGSASLYKDSFAEAPNGSVYYAVGRKVWVVNGTHAPALVTAERDPVIALAVNSTDFFMQVGLNVYEYGRRSEAYVRGWKLPGSAPTSAGLIAVGGTVWSWTDSATDESGFQYANVNKISTSSSAVKVIGKLDAYPGDMAADSAGLYFETVNGSAKGYLDHASTSGKVNRRPEVNLDAPVALAGGRIDLLSVHFSNSRTYADSYRASTLRRVSSVPVSGEYRDIAGTSAGLLVVKEPCDGLTCLNASVGALNPATGKVSGAVHIRHAWTLILGPAPAVLAVSGGRIYLVRLGG
jgi:hypothetical protein